MINDDITLEKINLLKTGKAAIKQQINLLQENSITNNTPFKNYTSILRTIITNEVIENDFREYPDDILGKIEFFNESKNNLIYLLHQVGLTGVTITSLDDIATYIPSAYEGYQTLFPPETGDGDQPYVYGYQGDLKCIYHTSTDSIQYVDHFQSDPCRTFKYCVIDDCSTRHINYYLNMTNMNLKEDGTAACLTGEDGDVFVEIPPFYFKCETLSNGTKRKLMSTSPFDGAIAHPFSMVSPDGQTVRTQYVGYYIGTLQGNLETSHTCIDFPWYDQEPYPSGFSRLRSINGGTHGGSHTRTWLRQSARHNGANLINTMFYAYLYDITLTNSEFPEAYLSPLENWVTSSEFFQGLLGSGTESDSDPVYLMQDGVQVYKTTPYKYTLSTNAYTDSSSAAESSEWLNHNTVMIGPAYSNTWGEYYNDGDLNDTFAYPTLYTGYKYKYPASVITDNGYLGKQTFDGVMTSPHGATDFPHIVIRGKNGQINYALHYVASLAYLHTRIQC